MLNEKNKYIKMLHKKVEKLNEIIEAGKSGIKVSDNI
jgi:hypothetical protein